MGLFSNLEAAAADPILGLTDAFNNEASDKKVNLSVGIYQDDTGKTPVLSSVLKAEKAIFKSQRPQGYLPINGYPPYNRAVQELVFSGDKTLLDSGRVVTVQSPGGTGGLRIGADFIKQKLPSAAIWVSNPTWSNHNSIFEAAGLEVKSYPYYDEEAKGLGFERFAEALRAIPEGDVVLLHGCCHNPTGYDPTAEQWETIGEILKERNLLPFVDFAYQGFGESIEKDAHSVQVLLKRGVEFLVCNSFSKNFSLYNQRVGALSMVLENKTEADSVLSHLKRIVRVNYSNPPAHGALIVGTVLGDAGLRSEWESEVAVMRERLSGMRSALVEKLASAGAQRDFSHIARQNGMFSYSGLSKDEVEALREQFAIYIVGSGRINVAGLTSNNLDYVAEAIVKVVG